MDKKKRAAQREIASISLQKTLGRYWKTRLAKALELNLQYVSRMFSPPKGRDDYPSTCIQALAEFLEETPEGKWPKRWRD